jgi:hypothetical protein
MPDKNRKKSSDEIHGRSFAGASYGANEREQTEDIERARRQLPDEAGEFITDAEAEVREANGDDNSSRR